MNTNSIDTRIVRNAIINSGTRRGNFIYADVPLDLLDTCEYQRPVHDGHVRALIANWNDDLCDDILVSHRDDCLYVIDGQSRAAAAREMGRETIGAKIISGLTMEDEAMLFATQGDTVRRLNGTDSFAALLVANNSTACGVKKLCDTYHIVVGSVGVYHLRAIKNALDIYDKDGGETLEFILKTVSDAGWLKHKACLSAIMMRALSYVYDALDPEDGKYDEVSKYLKNLTPRDLQTISVNEFPYITAPHAVSRMIFNNLNKA